MKKLQQTMLEIDGISVPAKIYEEPRSNVRVSIGKRAAILRLPIQMDKKQKKSQFGWFTRWVEKQFSNNTALRERFQPQNYRSGDTLQVGKRSYQLKMQYEDRKTGHARLNNGVITLKIPREAHPMEQKKATQHLLSRVIAQDFKPAISERVHAINDKYFQKTINSINLKYNTSNWGSCSTKGNVNLSTRLLFAPDHVIDYVIIHELTHLLEMNHSKKFWNIVASIMPDYKEKEKWLKKNGGQCDF